MRVRPTEPKHAPAISIEPAGAGITIEPWDYRYYAEKVRKARYDLDENEIKPYLQLDKLRDGVGPQVYGIGIKELWELEPSRHKAGLVVHTAGWPLDLAA